MKRLSIAAAVSTLLALGVSSLLAMSWKPVTQPVTQPATDQTLATTDQALATTDQALATTTTTGPAGAMPLSAVRSIMCQLQDLDTPQQVATLAASPYDLIIVEPTFTMQDSSDFDAKSMVAALHAGKPGRIVLAYVDVGEAESYRTYWKPLWHPPSPGQTAFPNYILGPDPDGWDENYPVAYWDFRWLATIATDRDSVVKSVMANGFDGVYLDWVAAYDDDIVKTAAAAAGVDPAKSMVDLIAAIRTSAQKIVPNAYVVAQNGEYLLNADPRLLNQVDAMSFDETWFTGKPEADWNDPAGGDVPNTDPDPGSSAARIRQYQKFQAAGKPIFTVDYCLKPENARTVYDQAQKLGFIPLVTQISCEQMTLTPPPSLKPN